MEKLTQDALKQLLDYDPETGFFSHRQSRRGVTAGMRAGTVTEKGYRNINLDHATYSANRLAWLYVHGEFPTGHVMPKNGQNDDARIANLRLTEIPGEVERKSVRGAYRISDLRRKFGLSVADYQRMFVAQNGACASCLTPETVTRGGEVKWLAVDHDHATGRIRGLLCQSCNVALGYLKDDRVRLHALVDYLDRHAAQPDEDANVIPMRSA